MRPLILPLSLTALVTACCGCGVKAITAPTAEGDEAATFLKWSMDRHKSLRSYHAVMRMTPDVDTGVGALLDSSQVTTIDYLAPNKYRIETSTMFGANAVVSDGTKQATYESGGGGTLIRDEAPATLASATGQGTTGLPLFRMFGGALAFGDLVDTTKGNVTFTETAEADDGANPTFSVVDVQPDGEREREVSFYGRGVIMHCCALIGERTGMTYRWTIVARAGPTPASAKPSGDEQAASPIQREVKVMLTLSVAPNMKLDPSLFDITKPPRNSGPDAERAFTKYKSPPPVKHWLTEGAPAPAFTAKTPSGRTVTLASLRGKPVLLDFWATWCPSCIQALPDTDRISQTYPNLTVLAISDEPGPKVEAFVKAHHYRFQACSDVTRKAMRAYHVSSIPCYVLINSEGRIAKMFVGEPDAKVMARALERVGAS